MMVYLMDTGTLMRGCVIDYDKRLYSIIHCEHKYIEKNRVLMNKKNIGLRKTDETLFGSAWRNSTK